MTQLGSTNSTHLGKHKRAQLPKIYDPLSIGIANHSDSEILGFGIISSDTEVIEADLAIYRISPDITVTIILEKLNSDNT